MRLISLVLAALVAFAAQAQTYKHPIPFMPSAGSTQLGIMRVINDSGRAGTVDIYATDDTGERFGPAVLSMEANQAVHLNSWAIENGQPSRGLATGVGNGEGNWWLELHTDLDIRPLVYIRTADGFLTSVYDVVAQSERDAFSGMDFVYQVPFFNPASNLKNRSILRLVNPNRGNTQVEIIAQDDTGSPSVTDYAMSLSPYASAKLTAEQLERNFGDGTGKWHLTIHSDNPIWIMSLLQGRTGHLTNLSSPVPVLVAEEPLPIGGVPPKPTGFEISCGHDWCMLTWDSPTSRYDNHKSTWVYRNSVDDFDSAERIGTAPWILYTDRGVNPRNVHYWIRWESTEGVVGPFASCPLTGHLVRSCRENRPPSGNPPPKASFLLIDDFLSNRVRLAWNFFLSYDDHALTHIFRGETNDVSQAQKIATSSSDSGWSEPFPPGPYPRTVWYWIRWENRSGMMGPYSNAQSAFLWPSP